jgi:uncharacterized protein (TIGR03118 family)
MRISRSVAAFAASCAFLALIPAAASAGKDHGFSTVDLVTDPTGGGPLIDPSLVNPWGLAAGPSTPLWVADNGTSMATIYAGATKKTPGFGTFRPPVAVGAEDPTGQVFNDNAKAFGGAKFIFASESGGIAAFTGGNTAPEVTSVAGAVFKGLALARSHGKPTLYATDFHNDAVDVFNSSFQMTGSFTDPNAPAGFAPFGIQAIGDRLYVTFAEQDADAHDDVPGAGHGVIDIFTPDGRLQRRLVTGGALNSPWGMVVAPGGFGAFHHDLLVGNFGDGAINAYDKDSGRSRGTLPIPLIDGLWGLRFGNGVAGDPKALLFSAGPNGESGGRLGEIVTTKG